MAKLTGERPMEGATPDSLLALHDAGYREVVGAPRARRRARRRVRCRRRDREAHRGRPPRHRRRLQRATTVSRPVARRDRSGPAVRGHGRRRARRARRLRRRGRARRTSSSTSRTRCCTSPSSPACCGPTAPAFVITPNAPADFENPFHVYLFEPAQLASMLQLFFEEVECLGLEGDDVLQRRLRGPARERRAHPAPRFARAAAPHPPPGLRVDVREGVAGRVPHARLAARPGSDPGSTRAHLFMTSHILPTTPVLFAIARGPRIPARACG